MITFEYKGKIYKPSNIENKLKKLGCTMADITILEDTNPKDENENTDLTYCQQNNLETYFYRTITNPDDVIVSSISETTLNSYYVSPGEPKYNYLGSSRNPETNQIETILDTEKRLNITYDSLLDAQTHRKFFCFSHTEEDIWKDFSYSMFDKKR